MRLLEVFLLLELKDRLAHIAQTMGNKIYKRFMKHMEEAGEAGLPRAWREAVFGAEVLGPKTSEESKKANGVEWIVEWFSQFDPSKNKKYTDWMIRQWLTEKVWLEDVSKFPTMLETFEVHKNNLKKMDIPSGDEDYRNDRPDAPVPPPERRSDINSWKDYRVLARILRPLTGTQAAGEKVSNFLKKSEIQNHMYHPVPDPVKYFNDTTGDYDLEDMIYSHRDNAGDDDEDFDTMDWYGFGMNSSEDGHATTSIKPIYQSDRLAVLQPNTRAAACELGKGTEWCTSSTESENYFWEYAPDGPLYVVLTDKMGKFQFHFESGQFANVHDEMLTNEQRAELVEAYPELKEIFGNVAMDTSNMWLVNGSEWDIKKVKRYMNRDDHSKDALKHAIKLWEGEAPEETLAFLENWIRTTEPYNAYAYVRDPQLEDYQAAVVEAAEGAFPPHRMDMLNVLRHARDAGVALDDNTTRVAIENDSRSLKHVSLEQLQKHPEWILMASDKDETWLKMAAAGVNKIPSNQQWGAMSDYLTDDVNEFIMKVFRDHPDGPKVVAELTKNRPKLVRYYLDYFGTDPWKRAYMYANAALDPMGTGDHVIAENNEMERMAETIKEYDMPNLDKVDLVTYLMKNGILHMGTFQAIENELGALPIEIQKALLNKSPAFIGYINNPDPQLKAAAMAVMGQGPKEFGDARRQHWTAADGGTKQAFSNFEKHTWLDMNDKPQENDHPVARAVRDRNTSFND